MDKAHIWSLDQWTEVLATGLLCYTCSMLGPFWCHGALSLTLSYSTAFAMDTVLFDCCFDIFATPSPKCEPWHLIPSVKKDSNLESVLLAKRYLLLNSVFLFKFMYYAYKKVHLRAGLVHSMIQSMNAQPFFYCCSHFVAL